MLVRERLIFFALRCTTLAGVGIILVVIATLWQNGSSLLSWTFLTESWRHQDIASGGIRQALWGSIQLGLGVILLSIPLSLGSALFLSEYSTHPIFQRILTLTIRNLAGVPSIVYGLFGLAMFVNTFHLGATLLSAILTLCVMTLPWMITTAVEALRTVPQAFRESSLALGATHWQTTWRIVLPAALPGCITGAIVGIARAMGETAPIILVGATFYLSQQSGGLLSSFMARAYHTFILATQHSSPVAAHAAAATALVLIATTLLLTIAAILARQHLRNQKDW